MKKRALICLCLVLALVFGMCIGTLASGGLETISAYLTYNTTIKLDGEAQILYDGNGDRVYPINYQGTTYLPIRAIANLFDVDVNWDGKTKTVLLGKTGEAQNFIENFKPYAYDNIVISTASTPDPKTVAGQTVSTYLAPAIGGYAKYDLGGKYETLTFSAYTGSNLKGDDFIQFFGDNNELLATITIIPEDLPKVHTINVTGVTQLTISCEHISRVTIFDAYIE